MNRRKTKEEFIEQAKKIHDNKYDYSKVEYTHSKTKVCIICPQHGEFWQTPNMHLCGRTCPKCGNKQRGKYWVTNTNKFIEKAKKVHGDKYDYSKVEYVNNQTKVCIICPTHGEFWQRPAMHLHGEGCPYCKKSKLEMEVEKILTENNIDFIKQCRKDTLEWLGKLSLDFFIPQYDIAIECQGAQHFEYSEFFGGENAFIKQLERDNRKAKLCLEHGVKLLYYTKLSLKPWYEVITDEWQLINIIKNGNT